LCVVLILKNFAQCFFCLSMSSGETLRLYDQNIESLVDDYMDWTVKYRTDAEIDKRNDLIVAKYGHNSMQDSAYFRKSSLDLAKSALYSNMIMAYLLAVKVKVPGIVLEAFTSKCSHHLSVVKRALPKEQVESHVRTLKKCVALFLHESGLFSYFTSDGLPGPSLIALWDKGITHLRKILILKVKLLEKDEQVGHEFLVMWELERVPDERGLVLHLNVIDNQPSARYTDQGENVDVHGIILSSLHDEIALLLSDLEPDVKLQVIPNSLPTDEHTTSRGRRISYTCMSNARRAVLYCAILRNKAHLSTADALETRVPMDQIFNPRKRKKMSLTEKRYAHNLMMYVNCLDRIYNYLSGSTMIWTNKNLLSLDPAAVARERPFPIYGIGFKMYNGSTMAEFLERYKSSSSNNGLFYLRLVPGSTALTLVNFDRKQEMKMYFDMENAAVFSEAMPGNTCSTKHCVISAEFR
jgi:hypothetical protein